MLRLSYTSEYGMEDCRLLEADIDIMVDWYDLHLMRLNVKKNVKLLLLL